MVSATVESTHGHGYYIVNREVRDTLLEKVSARTRANARAVVDWLVDNARWKDDAGGLMLKRGELVIGLEKTAAAIGVSVQNVSGPSFNGSGRSDF